MVVSASTVPPPATVAVTVTVRSSTPSAIEVWTPEVPPSASTDRSTVLESTMVSVAALTVKPEAEPVIDNASSSATLVSVLAVRVNVPDADDPSAAMVTSKASWPEGIE